MYSVFTLVLLFSALGLSGDEQTGNHPEWPRWCGKVYKPE